MQLQSDALGPTDYCAKNFPMPTAVEDVPMEDVKPSLSDKIQVLPGASADGSQASFQIKNEDHTLGNALRHMIMRNPEVEFCGYSIPHPSETKMNLRIQTYGEVTAIEALRTGLQQLVEVCDHVDEKFREKIAAGGYSDSSV